MERRDSTHLGGTAVVDPRGSDAIALLTSCYVVVDDASTGGLANVPVDVATVKWSTDGLWRGGSPKCYWAQRGWGV